MSRKPPAHLVRPIVYPTAGHVNHRTSAEIAAINDERRQPTVISEVAEAHRVAGVDPEGRVVEPDGTVRERAEVENDHANDD